MIPHPPGTWRSYLWQFFFFWLYHVACGILVPQQGIEPVPSGVKRQSPNHWATREVPVGKYLIRGVSDNSSAYANTPL